MKRMLIAVAFYIVATLVGGWVDRAEVVAAEPAQSVVQQVEQKEFIPFVMHAKYFARGYGPKPLVLLSEMDKAE